MGFTLRAALDALPADAAGPRRRAASLCRRLVPRRAGAAHGRRGAGSARRDRAGRRGRPDPASGRGAATASTRSCSTSTPAPAAAASLLRARHAGGDARRARAGRRLRGLVGAARSRLREAAARGGLRRGPQPARPRRPAPRGLHRTPSADCDSLAPEPRAAALGFWALALAFGLAQIAVHARADFSFPPPWIDEAQFLWQAKAVADTGTLLAPQLDPERPILLDAAGLVLGDGRGLPGARLRLRARAGALARLSAGGLRAAGGAAARASAPARARCCSRARSSSGRTFVAAGNVARMEALLLLGVLGGFALLRSGRDLARSRAARRDAARAPERSLVSRRRRRLGLADAARSARGSPRPDALGVAAAAGRRPRVARVRRARRCPPGGLRAGLRPTSSRARPEPPGSGLLVGSRLLALAALLLLARWLRREVPDAVLLACLAVPALLAHSIGQEYWYEVFEELFYLLLSLLALAAAGRWLARQPSLARHLRNRRRRRARPAAARQRRGAPGAESARLSRKSGLASDARLRRRALSARRRARLPARLPDPARPAGRASPGPVRPRRRGALLRGPRRAWRSASRSPSSARSSPTGSCCAPAAGGAAGASSARCQRAGVGCTRRRTLRSSPRGETERWYAVRR